MKTEEIRNLIVENAKNNLNLVIAQFYEPSDNEKEEIKNAAVNPDNWKRMSKYKEKHPLIVRHIVGEIHREFNCKPLDDQLRAEVITSPDDTEVLSIDVRGE